MNEHIKNIVVACTFMVLLLGLMIANLLSPPKAVSLSERRNLMQFPKIETKTIFNGDAVSDMEAYLLDQFVLREQFRSLKALASYDLFFQKDNNGVYVKDGGIYKMEYPLKEQSVDLFAQKINDLTQKFLQKTHVYYSIIPDKNYFVASKYGYLSVDDQKMMALLHKKVKGIGYIDLFNTLSIDDYYKTDIHWRQDKIIKVADRLLTGMQAKPSTASRYTMKSLQPFYGSYYGQAALPLPPDTLYYLTNPQIESCKVFDHQYRKYEKLYSPELFGGIDSYNFFLGGVKPLLTIENPNQKNGRELYIFRDSFSSSLAPLLTDAYEKITLIDLRYVDSRALGSFIQFKEGSDVLFLYNTSVVNTSAMLR